MTERIEKFIDEALERGWYYKSIIEAAKMMENDPSFDPHRWLMNNGPTIPNYNMLGF